MNRVIILIFILPVILNINSPSFKLTGIAYEQARCLYDTYYYYFALKGEPSDLIKNVDVRVALEEPNGCEAVCTVNAPAGSEKETLMGCYIDALACNVMGSHRITLPIETPTSDFVQLNNWNSVITEQSKVITTGPNCPENQVDYAFYSTSEFDIQMRGCKNGKNSFSFSAYKTFGEDSSTSFPFELKVTSPANQKAYCTVFLKQKVTYIFECEIGGKGQLTIGQASGEGTQDTKKHLYIRGLGLKSKNLENCGLAGNYISTSFLLGIIIMLLF